MIKINPNKSRSVSNKTFNYGIEYQLLRYKNHKVEKLGRP